MFEFLKGWGSKAANADPWTESPPTLIDQVALRWFGGFARKRLENHPELGNRLMRARISLVPVAFLSGVFLKTALVLGSGLIVFAMYMASARGDANPEIAVPLAIAPGLLASMVYSVLLLQPELKVTARKRNVEENLPYALNFMAAMSGAGVVPIEVFGALGKQKVYGEVAKEAAWIYRDAQILSKDLVSALKDAARRAPSTQLEEFLTGSVNTITSGGELRLYFLAKAEQFTQENRRRQRSFLEGLGVMAESYVVVGAAAPLFVVVIISIMVLVNSGGTDPTKLLNILVLLGLPVIHGMFTFLIRNMRPSS